MNNISTILLNNSAILLSELSLGKTALIADISSESKNQKVHLMNMGFVPGESVTPIFSSPAGDPTAYRLGSNVQIALRDTEAKKILVTEEA